MDATPRTEAGPEPVILGFTLTAGDAAAAPADVDRLRALLDTHVSRG